MTDDSPMPFGIHKGKLLSEVPASYLLWLWDEGGVWQEPHKPIHGYIKESFSALETECKDYIVQHRPK